MAVGAVDFQFPEQWDIPRPGITDYSLTDLTWGFEGELRIAMLNAPEATMDDGKAWIEAIAAEWGAEIKQESDGDWSVYHPAEGRNARAQGHKDGSPGITFAYHPRSIPADYVADVQLPAHWQELPLPEGIAFTDARIQISQNAARGSAPASTRTIYEMRTADTAQQMLLQEWIDGLVTDGWTRGSGLHITAGDTRISASTDGMVAMASADLGYLDATITVLDDGTGS